MRPPRFYAIRQARSKVIGSRAMLLAEAEREVRIWGREIGPARVVPAAGLVLDDRAITASDLAHAIRYYDQAVLVPLLALRSTIHV
jgi:hypothetical protein